MVWKILKNADIDTKILLVGNKLDIIDNDLHEYSKIISYQDYMHLTKYRTLLGTSYINNLLKNKVLKYYETSIYTDTFKEIINEIGLFIDNKKKIIILNLILIKIIIN